ncbi:MAG: acyltransferase [Deltaproteobacteria bacterium]|nr:acyltransferase [Deltaproteobacteria bacterium]
MRHGERIRHGQEIDVEYEQFAQSPTFRFAFTVAGVLTWPLIVPLALIARASDFVFRTIGEVLAVMPYLLGVILRYEFYRWTLRRCGENVIIGHGTIFLYRDVEIGNHVLIGMYNVIHHCDFGSYVLTAEGCRFLSGARYHNFERTDMPMALQGGKLRRIQIGDDCWIGTNAVVMDDVGVGSIVGAGAIVTAPVEPYTIVVGNPARPVRKRTRSDTGQATPLAG